MLKGFDFTKIVLLSILIFTIEMPVILSLFNTRILYVRCAAPTQSNW